eukprot:SM000117S25507  [mRNA]  locus=s117:223326:226303:+ [translate_table: standard]
MALTPGSSAGGGLGRTGRRRTSAPPSAASPTASRALASNSAAPPTSCPPTTAPTPSTDASGAAGPAVRFSYLSPDGDQAHRHSRRRMAGFPGELAVSVTYTLSGDSELRVEMEATPSGRATPVSLAHHTYWNLGGHGSGDVLLHRLRLSAPRYTPVDASLIPTGAIAPVAGTPFDFTEEKEIGAHIGDVPGGYDHNWVVQDKLDESEEGLRLVARVTEPRSGRVLMLWATAPGVQFYSGNFLDGTVTGKDGVVYGKHAGFCLETQGFPNAVSSLLWFSCAPALTLLSRLTRPEQSSCISSCLWVADHLLPGQHRPYPHCDSIAWGLQVNERKFPSIFVHPGEVYRHVMVHRFSVEQSTT